MRIPVSRIAHGRSGDKGDTANVGVIAFEEKHYPILVREVTAARVKAHFGSLVHGKVERFELPNLGALNFLLHESLGGGFLPEPESAEDWQSRFEQLCPDSSAERREIVDATFQRLRRLAQQCWEE